MAQFDFIITDQDAGRVLGVPDGYLVKLTRTTPPAHETPSFDEGRRKWTAGYFVIKGERDLHALVCLDARNGGAFAYSGPDANMVINGSIGYRGDLVVVAVPRGSQWSITLSDTPTVCAPQPPDINFTNSNYTPVNRPPVLPPRQLVMVELRP